MVHLGLADKLMRVSMHFDRQEVEVKVDQSTSMADIRQKLRMIDRQLRMEVFSLTSEQEYRLLIERQRSNQAVLLTRFCKPWTESELLIYLRQFGNIDELHSYRCKTRGCQQVVVVFKSVAAKDVCVEAASHHKQFEAKPLEDINLDDEFQLKSSPASNIIPKDRQTPISKSNRRALSIDLRNMVCNKDYYYYSYKNSRVRLDRKQLRRDMILSKKQQERLERSVLRDMMYQLTLDLPRN